MASVDLIRGTRQTLWGKLAVANFVLGGLGAGFYLAAVGFGSPAELALAGLLGPTLVLSGFVAVALEAGRPLRGARVLRRVPTSWMSRELWLGGAFALLAVGGIVRPEFGLYLLAALAALSLMVAQGFILRAARGVPNWNVQLMPPLFAASALVSGSGLFALSDALTRTSPGQVQLATSVVLLVLAGLVWVRYRGRVRQTRSEDMTLLIAGYVAPIVLLLIALLIADVATPATALAGLLMIGGQVQAKALVVLRAGELRSIRVIGVRGSPMARTTLWAEAHGAERP
jgi:DMSO reductase anchor subunit